MGTDNDTGTEVFEIQSTGTEYVRVKFEQYSTETGTASGQFKIWVREKNTGTTGHSTEIFNLQDISIILNKDINLQFHE